jgi:hypothetical protein
MWYVGGAFIFNTDFALSYIIALAISHFLWLYQRKFICTALISADQFQITKNNIKIFYSCYRPIYR